MSVSQNLRADQHHCACFETLREEPQRNTTKTLPVFITTTHAVTVKQSVNTQVSIAGAAQALYRLCEPLWPQVDNQGRVSGAVDVESPAWVFLF